MLETAAARRGDCGGMAKDDGGGCEWPPEQQGLLYGDDPGLNGSGVVGWTDAMVPVLSIGGRRRECPAPHRQPPTSPRLGHEAAGPWGRHAVAGPRRLE
jgi:hypothetical protein